MEALAEFFPETPLKRSRPQGNEKPGHTVLSK